MPSPGHAFNQAGAVALLNFGLAQGSGPSGQVIGNIKPVEALSGMHMAGGFKSGMIKQGRDVKVYFAGKAVSFIRHGSATIPAKVPTGCCFAFKEARFFPRPSPSPVSDAKKCCGR